MLSGGVGEFVLRVSHPEGFCGDLAGDGSLVQHDGMAAMYASGPDMKASKVTCGR